MNAKTQIHSIELEIEKELTDLISNDLPLKGTGKIIGKRVRSRKIIEIKLELGKGLSGVPLELAGPIYDKIREHIDFLVGNKLFVPDEIHFPPPGGVWPHLELEMLARDILRNHGIPSFQSGKAKKSFPQ